MNISAVLFSVFLCQSALFFPAAPADGSSGGATCDKLFDNIHRVVSRGHNVTYDLDGRAIDIIRNRIQKACQVSFGENFFYEPLFLAAMKLVANKNRTSANSWSTDAVSIEQNRKNVWAIYLFFVQSIDSSVRFENFKNNSHCRSDLLPIIDRIVFDRNVCNLSFDVKTELGKSSIQALTNYLRFIAINACEKRKLSEMTSNLPGLFESLRLSHEKSAANLFFLHRCPIQAATLSSLSEGHECRVVQEFLEGQSSVLALACKEQKQALVAECLIPAIEQKNERSMMQRFYDKLRLFAENNKSLAQKARQAELDRLDAEWRKGADNIYKEANSSVFQLQISPQERRFLSVDGCYVARQYDLYFPAPGQQGLLE